MKTLGPAASWEDEEDALSRRAVDFFVRRRFGQWSDADQAELDGWIAQSFLHRVAYVRVEGIAARTDEVAALRAPKRDRAAPARDRKFHYRRFAIPLLVAASTVLVTLFALPLVRSLLQPPDRTYSTEVGGRTTLKFADGTVVDLNTDTSVRFRMTTAERTVWLEKGEAWFHVSHDAAHPFAVNVGRHRITDLGTEFLVRSGADRMEVALVKGRAALSTEGAPVATLTPGEDAVATPASLSVTRKTPQELADALAWRRGMLVFRDAKLADAVREINRYNAVKLVIADPSIADLRFNGEIKNDNVDDFLGLAKIMMQLRADRQGKRILLSRAMPERTKRTPHAGRSGSEAVAQ